MASAKMIIELDGSQHYAETNHQKDHERDLFLQSIGVLVLRYSNEDVNRRFQDICEAVLHHVYERIAPSP